MNTGGLSVKTFVALIATVMLLVTASQSQLFASAPIEDRAPADILSSNNVARLLAETPLEASGNAGDQFGNAVAITAEFAVVGAHRVDQGLSNEAGAVYVFHRDEGGAENWGLVKALEPSDGLSNDVFGTSLAISGNTIVVGAAGADIDGVNEAGAVYVFERNQGGSDNWGEVAKLTANDGQATDVFGGAVAIDGDIIVVGASGAAIAYPAQGAAYIYSRDLGGADNWGFDKKLFDTTGQSQDKYGESVAISDSTVIIGAPHKMVNSSVAQGAAFVYHSDQGGVGNWGLSKQLLASDGALNSYFGNSVSISEDTIAVGAYGTNATTGSAYVFDRDTGGTNSWGQVTKLVAGDGSTGDKFGATVSVRGSAIIIGAPSVKVGVSIQQGASYIFQRYQGGIDNWGEVSKITASSGTFGDNFGHSVSISGPFALIGAPFTDTATNADEGAAFVARWQQECRPLAGSATALASAFGNAACSPIIIDPGTYEGCYELAHDAAVIAGGSAAETILDGEGICPTITIKPGIDATIHDVTVTGGKGENGGGISNDNGVVYLEDVIVTGNEAFFGGGLFNGNGGTATVVSSAIVNNEGTSQGGGIYNGPDSDLDIWNTTLSGNVSPDGGGVYNVGRAKAVNATISDNEESGIVVDGGEIEMTNSVVAANRTGNCVDKNSGVWNSGGYNLFDDTTCNFTSATDSVVDDAGLKPLANYGGIEPSHALKYTSPALDVADDAVCAAPHINSVDQRGVARPYNGRCDIGAYESDQRACTIDVNDGEGLESAMMTASCNPIIIPEGEFEGCFALDHNAEIWGEGADKTTLKGEGDCSTVTVGPNVNGDIRDLTITGGNGTEGGGVDNNGGDLHLEDVVIADNVAQVGGGIDNDDGGTVVLVSSLVADNEATTQGGGINNGADSTLQMWNSTISSNKSPLGGGLYNLGTTQSTNVTVAQNDTQGLHNAAGSITIVNTLIAENGAVNCVNTSGVIASTGNNLADDATCNLASTGDQIVADAGIKPLRDNGGTEKTHALKHTSLALDSGNDAVCTAPHINSLDQRGMSRPFEPSCDVGAFESHQRACDVDASDASDLTTKLSDAECNPIILPPGTYTGCFTVTHNTEIIGDGSDETIIEGEGDCTTITIAPDVNLDLADVFVTGGNGMNGGGIDNNGGDLYVEDVVVADNTAQVGGGIDNDGGGSLTVVSSSIVNNEATAQAGGINNGVDSKLALWNATISSNKAPVGAGIYNAGSAESTNATIAFNENDGIYNSLGTFTYINTLLASHSEDNCVNRGGTLVSISNNVADDSTCSMFRSTDQVVPDVKLNPLDDNGGNEPTHTMHSTSAAVDSGSLDACQSTMIGGVDQRGVARPFGSGCEVGAVEMDNFLGNEKVYLPMLTR